MKKYYYVVLFMDVKKGARLVTRTDNATKMAFWNENEKPLAMSKSSAEDLAYCLGLNCYPAFVLESFYKFDDQPFIVKEGEQ